jgi:GntR family transcriptional repressor for pyruvate dehydrogenase complex
LGNSNTGEATIFNSLHLEREKLHNQIADRVEEMIANKQLQPGTQLPSERELAKSIGVNRATIREAIRVLEQRGLVQMRSGSGTYVTDVSSSTVKDSLERYFAFGSCSHEDLIKLREILEPEIAALAADRATAAEVERLRELVEEIDVAFKEDVARYAASDAEFHETLAKATHNALIIAITGGLHLVMTRWILAQSTSKRLEGGARSHRAIYEAIAERSPEAARRAMRIHHQFTRAALIDDVDLVTRSLAEITRSGTASATDAVVSGDGKE